MGSSASRSKARQGTQGGGRNRSRDAGAQRENLGRRSLTDLKGE